MCVSNSNSLCSDFSSMCMCVEILSQVSKQKNARVSSEAQQRYCAHCAMLLAIASLNSFVLVLMGIGRIAHLSRNMLQNGVSHRCVCVKLTTQGGITPFGGVLLPCQVLQSLTADFFSIFRAQTLTPKIDNACISEKPWPVPARAAFAPR